MRPQMRRMMVMGGGAKAKIYYVDATLGLDTNTGLTLAAPWKTIAKVNGATYGVRESVLFNRGESWVGTTTGLQVKAGVTYADYGTGALPIIQTTTAATYTVRSSGYARVNNVTLRNLHLIGNACKVISQNEADQTDTGGWQNCLIDGVESSGPWNLVMAYSTVKNCTVYGTTNPGPTGTHYDGIEEQYAASHHNVYYNNTVFDFATRGIWTRMNTHDDVFSYNTIYSITSITAGAAIDIDGASHISYRHNVHHNVIHDCGYLGIELENSFDCNVYNNSLVDVTGGPINVINYSTSESLGGYGNGGDLRGYFMNNRIYCNRILRGATHDYQGGIGTMSSGGNYIYHNTIVGTDISGIGIVGDNGTTPYGTTNVVENNIIVDTVNTAAGKRLLLVSRDNDACWAMIATDDYNCMYKSGVSDVYGAFFSNAPKTIAQYQAITGNAAKAAHSITTDPVFVDKAGGNFHLNANTSPAYHAGVSGTGVLTDFDGVAFDASNPSMGCYEYV